jgi:DNA end-binding protein Ku
MAASPSWKGFLKLSLVAVPVKAYTATASGGGRIQLNQLHAECNSRIQYKKTCPIHGEVPNTEIVSGYEYTKGQYVIVNPAELDMLRSEADKAITVSAFVAPDAIDLMYYDERTYYLVPDGPVGQRPYAVLLQAMEEENRYAVAQVVMHGREQLVLLRPMDKLLAMTVLKYDAEVTKPQAFDDQAPQVELSGEERELAKRLVTVSTAKKFDYSTYRDLYTEKLTKLIEAKVAGEEIAAPPSQEPAHIINLMDALRASLANAEQQESAEAKPEKRMAPSKGKDSRARKRKTS